MTKLAFRSPNYGGLNLTRTTLRGILKYPWPRGRSKLKSKKWGAYSSEKEELIWAKKPKPLGDERRSIEAEIMDWADDVTYSVHDVEDFYRAGLIPLHLLAAPKETERRKFFDEVFARRRRDPGVWRKYTRAALESAFLNRILLFQIERPYSGNQEDRSQLRRFAGRCIDDFVHAIWLRNPGPRSQNYVEIDSGREKEVAMLKELTWHYVINNPSMASQQEGQRCIIRGLFSCFHKAALKKRVSIFPVFYRELLKDATKRDKARYVIDLIAGMTERQAVAMHLRISGASPSVTLERILD